MKKHKYKFSLASWRLVGSTQWFQREKCCHLSRRGALCDITGGNLVCFSTSFLHNYRIKWSKWSISLIHGKSIDQMKAYNCWKTFDKGNFCIKWNLGRVRNEWKMQDVRRSYLVFVHFYSTWRNCDSPHRLSTAAWQIDDSGAWIPRCSQTALSVVNQSQKERFLKKKRETVCCASLAVGVQTSPGLILM